jgi:hypothetical protein
VKGRKEVGTVRDHAKFNCILRIIFNLQRKNKKLEIAAGIYRYIFTQGSIFQSEDVIYPLPLLKMIFFPLS